MVALALGVLTGAGIVMVLALDWIKHPDLIPVPISEHDKQTSEDRRASMHHSRRR